MNKNLQSALRYYAKSHLAWIFNITGNVLFIPAFAYLISQHGWFLAVVTLACLLFVLYCSSVVQHLIIRKGEKYSDEYAVKNRDREKEVEQLNRYLKIKSYISCIPMLGLISYWFGIKANFIIYSLNNKYRDSLHECRDNFSQMISAWKYLHILNIAACNAICVLAIYSWNNYKAIIIPLAAFILGTYLISAIINFSLIKKNCQIIKKLINLDKETKDELCWWRTLMKVSFISYIPGLNIFGLIPFFILLGSIWDAKDDPTAQYINKCSFLAKTMFAGTLIPSPYIASFVALKLYSISTFTIIPLIILIATPLVINLFLYVMKLSFISQQKNNISKFKDFKYVHIMARVSLYSTPLIILAIVPIGVLWHQINLVKKKLLFNR